VSATAGEIVQLVAGRALQGIGGASLLGLSLAIATVAFPPDERDRALGIWAAVSSIALAIGPLVGGTVIELASWRWIFWLNVPLLALAVAIVAAATPETRDETAGHELDIPGLVTITVGLTAIVLALVQGKQWGWESPATLGVLAAGVAFLAAFAYVELRVPEPIVDLHLFRSGPYFGATAAAFALVGSYWTIMFFIPQYLELGLDYSTLASGLLILPVTAPMVVISPLAGKLVGRLGARTLMTAGMALAALGALLIAVADDFGEYVDLLPGLLLFGLALGLVYAPLAAAAMSALPVDKAGVAAGVLAMGRTIGGALLLAVCGAVFQHVEIESRADGDTPPEALSHALSGGMVVVAAVLALGTLLTAIFIRSAPRERPRHHHHFHL
jgi:EmrB/QacA subfamily drug resistance transporter